MISCASHWLMRTIRTIALAVRAIPSVAQQCRGIPLRLVYLILPALLLSACASTGDGRKGKDDLINIYVEENRSIDSSVRREFDAATELMRAGEHEKAIHLLLNVTKITKKNSAPFINLAVCYSIAGKLEEAEKAFRRALEINPTHPVANNEYALWLRKSGRYSEAREAYATVLQSYPDYLPVRRNLGVLCELYLNDADCAVEHYEYYRQFVPEDKEVELWLNGLKR